MKTITNDILKVAKIASKDTAKPTLSTIQITNDKIIATDGYKLLEATLQGFDSSQFPIVNNTELVEKIETPILIDAKAILKKIKFTANSPLPILDTAILTNENENSISVTTTDLTTATTTQFKKIKMNFPDYKRIMPEDECNTKVTIDARYLIELLNAFTDKEKSEVSLEFRGHNKPLVLKGMAASNKNKTGLLMPLKN